MPALTWAVAKLRPGHRARRCLPWALLASLALPPALAAHEVRPAYLEVTEVSTGSFEVLWKQPILADADPGLVLRLPIAPRFPAHCREGDRALPDLTAAALIERWTLTCGETGLTGAAISIDGLPRTLTDVLLRARPAGRDVRRSPAPLGGAARGAVRGVGQRGGRPHLPAARHRAPAVRIRPHPVRRRAAVLRTPAAATRAGGHGVHRGPQHHPWRCRLWGWSGFRNGRSRP